MNIRIFLTLFCLMCCTLDGASGRFVQVDALGKVSQFYKEILSLKKGEIEKWRSSQLLSSNFLEFWKNNSKKIDMIPFEKFQIKYDSLGSLRILKVGGPLVVIREGEGEKIFVNGRPFQLESEVDKKKLSAFLFKNLKLQFSSRSWFYSIFDAEAQVGNVEPSEVLRFFSELFTDLIVLTYKELNGDNAKQRAMEQDHRRCIEPILTQFRQGIEVYCKQDFTLSLRKINENYLNSIPNLVSDQSCSETFSLVSDFFKSQVIVNSFTLNHRNQKTASDSRQCRMNSQYLFSFLPSLSRTQMGRELDQPTSSR